MKANTSMADIKKKLNQAPIEVIQVLARGIISQEKEENSQENDEQWIISSAPVHYAVYFTVTLMMEMSLYGLSVFGFVFVVLISCTTSIPFTTRPKTVCLLSSQGCNRKNINDQNRIFSC